MNALWFPLKNIFSINLSNISNFYFIDMQVSLLQKIAKESQKHL